MWGSKENMNKNSYYGKYYVQISNGINVNIFQLYFSLHYPLSEIIAHICEL